MDSFLPGSASLTDMLDHSIFVMLRDGLNYVGTLLSYDQFGNLILHNTRQISSDAISIIPDVLLIRGENIVLCGQTVDTLKDLNDDGGRSLIKSEEMEAREDERLEERKVMLETKSRNLAKIGFADSFYDGDLY